MSEVTDFKKSIFDIKALVDEYPRLGLPITVFIALIGLATIIKTLVDGFEWAATGGMTSIGVALSCSFILLFLLVHLAHKALLPRPTIKALPVPYLSKFPTLRWTYDEPLKKTVTYRIVLRNLDDGNVQTLNVPQHMYHRVLRNIHGKFSVKVQALVNHKVIRTSKAQTIEIYPNAIQRIISDKKIRIAVHEDPGEEIFCYYSNNDWEGFDIDFAKIIANELKAKLSLDKDIKTDFLYYPWPEVISAPNDFTVDISIASISINKQREKQNNIIFTRPYAKSNLGVVAHANNIEGKLYDEINIEQLIRKNIAVHCETTASKLLEAMQQDERYKDKLEVCVVDNNDKLREMLKNNDVDVVMYDYERAFSMLEEGMVVLKLNHDLDLKMDDYGVVLSKISVKLRDLINDIINENETKLSENLQHRLLYQSKRMIQGIGQ